MNACLKEIDVNPEVCVPDSELQHFLEKVYDTYGYDFRHYAHASLRRRLRHRLMLSGFTEFGALSDRVLRDRGLFDTVIQDLSITTTEMFRDSSFFLAFREEVVPHLRTYASFKIWQAGCATGEETYSLAILLKEEGLLERAMIYATDFNPVALDKARKGIYPAELIRGYTTQFHKCGGRGPFSQHFSSRYDSVLMDKSLTKNVVFSEHNLATDGVFSEVQVVVCRNVLIYFDRTLQNRAIGVFHESLGRRGFLCLGAKESLLLSQYRKNFEVIREQERIFRKKG